MTFGPYRSIELVEIDQTPECLLLVYKFDDLGYWEFAIEPEKVTIKRI